MLALRSLAFNFAFYANLIMWLLASLPVFGMRSEAALRYAQAWSRSSLWLMRVVAGMRVEFRGLERIPAGGLLVAAKHQSVLETFALLTIFDRPTFILKRELTWIPIFGQLLVRAGMIPIDRAAGRSALAIMGRRARAAVEEGRQVVIFPEGTRRPPGAPPDYHGGVTYLHRQLGTDCLPVALNSGWFWPRRRFLRRPGTVVIEVLPAIPASEPRATFAALLEAEIEAASDRLLASVEAAAS